MEADGREASWEQTSHQRRNNSERSPAGSVEARRERAAAGFNDAPPMPLSSRSLPTSPPYRSPLSVASPRSDPTSPGSTHQRQPPQRPPRPNYVPPMLQNPPPAPNYWEDGRDSGYSGYSSYSSSSRPSTTTTGSSTASIPDFPTPYDIPAMPNPSSHPPPRRLLGPPPTARRGASSYYLQSPSSIPAIAEEQSDKHSSYASSHLMPESWGEASSEYGRASGITEEEEEEDYEQRQGFEDSSGRQSKASDYSESSNLVKPLRQKPLQPFMETIESGDESASQSSRGTRGNREFDWQQQQDQRFRQNLGGLDGIGRHIFRGHGDLHHPYSGYASDATFLDSPRSASPPSMPPMPKNNHNTPSPKPSPVDPTMRQIMSNLEKGGALTASGPTSPGTSAAPSIHEKAAKRPPSLNAIFGNGKQQGHSSNSSLPELIRRATRLASNLDRGKTASRVGMLDALARKDQEKHQIGTGKASHNGSISDIIAAFPSLSPTTSPGPNRPRDGAVASPHGKSNLSRSQTVYYPSSHSHGSHAPERRRRYCGLPVWAFILLLIILLLIIAAAVVIPVTLIVIPRQDQSSPTLESCKESMACLNGGSSVVMDNQCRCICAGGYTGATCTTAPEPDCRTIALPMPNSTATYADSTVGSAIPRILSGAQSNFSIPLLGYRLAALFSYSNLSCTAENVLITFDNSATSKLRLRSLTDLLSPEALVPRDLPTKTLSGRASAQSSNGIVFAGPPTGQNPSEPKDAPPPPSANSTDIMPVTDRIKDFARTAVLYIFQESGHFILAQTASTRLNGVLSQSDGFDATQPVTVGSAEEGWRPETANGGVSVDLKALTVAFGNGTMVGGRSGSGRTSVYK